MTEPLLRVRGLAVDFAGTPAVRDLHLELDRGHCLALVGESGSGKSVTARALLGLAGPRATVRAQRLELDGTALLTLSRRQWRALRGRRIALVLQDALTSLDPLRRVGHEVAEPLEVHRLVRPEELDDAVLDLLDRVGIPDPEERLLQFPHELSGGLRQRALIASAIAGRPDLLIADEPTTALDVGVQAQILDLLRDHRDAGTAILLISHDLAVVATLADTVAVMYAGVVVEHGSAAAVLAAPAHPYTAELLSAAPRVDGLRHRAGTRPWSAPASTGCPFAGRCPLTEDRCREALPAPIELEDGRTVRCLHPAEHREPVTAAVPVPLAPAHGETPLLEFSSVTYRYRAPNGRSRTAVDEVSLQVYPGEALGIIGESGSGKSTLAALALAHLIPDAGTVGYAGGPWSALRERQRRPLRRRIQLIDQDPLSAFDPRWAVADIIGEALPVRRTRAGRIDGLLTAVGLEPAVRSRRPAELSGGQRQRVAIARALAVEPELIVADEPVSALDVTIGAQILDLFEQIRIETGTALIFITHDLAVARRLCTHLAVLHEGRVVEYGPAAEIFDEPRNDYTRALLAASHRL
ncbi:dipeptide ABC transporter ATP-binding protein [Nocardia stercoris]|uniref:ABC transporter ATP-binding protein n=1 Tax=Nocardia stercoris TaxID=2483361 RepID=A0A3M2L0B6_9NOCA|nr:ABC transporter ATP-binding protein [Nocardia stercoris]RMI31169.1 ABC transporter ATP-binding protein [Nocardia stercoris]